jgi:hypothetical protein
MCSKTTAKYYYKDKSFCFKYEYAKYLKSQGMNMIEIASIMYPGKNVTDGLINSIRQLVYHNSIDRSKNKLISEPNVLFNDPNLTWSKVEYYSLTFGTASIKVAPELVSRLSIENGVLVIK